MNSTQVFDQIDHQLIALTGVAIVIVVLLLLWINRHIIVNRYAEWRTERCLNSIGVEQIRHVTCPDGLDGFFKIDRLALTPKSIVLISHKRYAGRIYCAEQIAEWTQVIGQKSFKFENPLFELENQITALKLLTGSPFIYGYLFFNQTASFPKGYPGSVLLQDQIPDSLLRSHTADTPIQPAIQDIWNRLQSMNKDAPGEGSVRAES